MRSADRRRLTIVLAASGIAHLGMFALLAPNPPRLRQGDAPPIFQVKVVPFIPPPLAKDRLRGFDEKVAAQEQMRIHRRSNIYPGIREALRAAR